MTVKHRVSNRYMRMTAKTTDHGRALVVVTQSPSMWYWSRPSCPPQPSWWRHSCVPSGCVYRWSQPLDSLLSPRPATDKSRGKNVTVWNYNCWCIFNTNKANTLYLYAFCAYITVPEHHSIAWRVRSLCPVEQRSVESTSSLCRLAPWF